MQKVSTILDTYSNKIKTNRFNSYHERQFTMLCGERPLGRGYVSSFFKMPTAIKNSFVIRKKRHLVFFGLVTLLRIEKHVGLEPMVLQVQVLSGLPIYARWTGADPQWSHKPFDSRRTTYSAQPFKRPIV